MIGLHVDSVIKSFGGKQVLTDIFVRCIPGEIIGLLGRNGSGKSTLLKIIFGSLDAERKFIRVDSKLITSLFANRHMVSYLTQDSFLPNHVKIKNIISMFCDKEHIEKIKQNSFIIPFLDKRVKQLSGGEKRIIEILLISHSTAKYVLIDEPFNGVAPVYKDEIKEVIKELSLTKGFIITDHDYRNILDISTRTIVMHDGGIKKINKADELKHYGYLPNSI